MMDRRCRCADSIDWSERPSLSKEGVDEIAHPVRRQGVSEAEELPFVMDQSTSEGRSPSKANSVISAPNPKWRVLLADDHAIVREGIRSLLDAEPDLHVVGEVGSAEDALAFLGNQQVDLVTLDLRMPGMPADLAVQRVQEACPAVRVLVLTSYFLDAEVHAVLAAGACGYVLKDARREDILTAVRAVLAGESWIDPPLQGRVLQLLRRPQTPLMTPREREVLDLLGRGLSNKRIAQVLDITEGTVKSYLRQVFPKIGASDRLQAALYARGLIGPRS